MEGSPPSLAVMRACEGCRKRKIKCDAATTNQWPCGSCVRLSFPQPLPSTGTFQVNLNPPFPVVPHQSDIGTLELPSLLQSLSTGGKAVVSNDEEDVDLDSDEGCGIMFSLGDGLVYDLGARKLINFNVFEELIESSLLQLANGRSKGPTVYLTAQINQTLT